MRTFQRGLVHFTAGKNTPFAQRPLSLNLSSWHNPCAGHLSKRLLLLLCLGSGFKKTTKPRAPRTLQLQMACQGEHSTVPSLFLPHLAPSEAPMCRAPQPQPKTAFTAPLRVQIEKNTKPRAQGILTLQNTCQGDHGTAPILLPPHLPAWHPPCTWYFSSSSFCCSA